MNTTKSNTKISKKIADLEQELLEANEMIQAIRTGAVDALVVSEPNGHKVFTLRGEDYTYRVLVEQMNEGAITTTAEGTILYSNRSFSNIIEIPLEKLTGSEFNELVSENSNLQFKKLMRKGIKTGSIGEIELKNKSGALIPVIVSIKPLQIYDIDALSIIITDISQLKVSQKLKDSELKFRLLAENIPTLAWMARPDGYIYWYNSRWYEYTGTNPKDMEGWGWQSVHDAEVLPKVLEKWKSSIATGESFEMVFPLKNADGEFHPFLTRVIPLRDEKGRIIQWFGTNTDITKQIELERQKDEFLGIASHELKTPVTSIKAYGQVLQTMFERNGDIKAANHLKKMDVQINKLTNLIGDLLDVTKIQSGKILFNKETFDFNELIDEMTYELQLTTDKHQLTRELDKSVKIFADRERIGQVLTNLITNAIKYSPHSHEIIISTKVYPKKVELSVRDFGVGIPKEKQEQVFEQFFRVSGPEQSTFPGLGLGLYVSSEIIKREGGRIWVESVVGKGSTFKFTLPILKK